MSVPPDDSRELENVIVLPRHEAPPSVVAIASGKGGVGRTHVAVNLACAWRAAGFRTLVLDADLALGGADLLLGVAPTNTVADVIEGRCSASDAIAEAAGGVHLLPASGGRWDLAVLGEERRNALLSAVRELEPEYDSVIIDLPAGLSPDALGFCSVATAVIAVATPDPASVESVATWLCALATASPVRSVSVLANLVTSAAEGREVFRRVLRRADQRPVVSARMAIDDAGALPLDPAVRRASLRGRPFVLAEPRCAAAVAVTETASALASRVRRHAPTAGLFWRRSLRATSAARPELRRHY